jgi:DNA-binding transcriptional LysR family regulator
VKWNAGMSELSHIRLFVAVAELGGFAAAARSLHVSPPAATRGIAALEARLDARLLRRTTRSVKLTEAGERFLVDCRRILADLEHAEAVVRGAHVEPQGELGITAPVMFGRMHVAPLVLEFLSRHERVTARTYFADRIVHLLDEGYDVAVRIADLPDSSSVALRVGEVRRVVVGAPSYLAAHGIPRDLAALPAHHAIGISRSGARDAAWTFGSSRIARRTPQPQMRLLVNANDVAIAAAIAGHGLTRALSYQVAREVAEGRLQIVLREHEPPPIPVYLVYPEGRLAAAKVRAFVELAAERLRADPALRAAPQPNVKEPRGAGHRSRSRSRRTASRDRPAARARR